MKRLNIWLGLVLILLLTTGCVRGEVLLDIGRTGSAELSTKLLVAPMLKEALKPVRDKFTQDKFAVMDLKEAGMEGFHATRSFTRISDMKDIAIFKGMNIQQPRKSAGNIDESNGSEQDKAKGNLIKEPKFTVEKGIFMDTYKIDADIDLSMGKGNGSKEENFVVKNLMSQIDLRFVAKLPTKTIKNNANQVSDDGRTLVWKLALGENNQIVAEATMINFVNVGILLVVILCLFAIFFYRRRRNESDL